MNDFGLTNATMALPLRSDQAILEVVRHWNMDAAYTDDDDDDDDDEPDDVSGFGLYMCS